MAMKSLRLAVDTNVLLDLADRVDTVVDAFALLDQRLPGNEMFVVPSVLDELVFLCDFRVPQGSSMDSSFPIDCVQVADFNQPCLERGNTIGGNCAWRQRRPKRSASSLRN